VRDRHPGSTPAASTFAADPGAFDRIRTDARPTALSAGSSGERAKMHGMDRDSEQPAPRDVLQKQRRTILSLLAERGAREVRVFGSLARGDDDLQSDIDLLVPDAGSAGRSS
jgi:hypothetical protein